MGRPDSILLSSSGSRAGTAPGASRVPGLARAFHRQFAYQSQCVRRSKGRTVGNGKRCCHDRVGHRLLVARAPQVFPGVGMMSAEEDILDALSQLLETAKSIERTIGPFVEDGLRFTPTSIGKSGGHGPPLRSRQGRILRGARNSGPDSTPSLHRLTPPLRIPLSSSRGLGKRENGGQAGQNRRGPEGETTGNGRAD